MGSPASFPKRPSSGFSDWRSRWSRSAAILTSLPIGFGKSRFRAERPALLRLHHDFSNHLARFEHFMGAAGFGEFQAGMDQRLDAAGGEVIEQGAVCRRAGIGPAVETVNREKAHRRTGLVVLAHRLHETRIGRAVE